MMPNEASKDLIAEWLRYLGGNPVVRPDPQSAWNLEFNYPVGTTHRMVVASPAHNPAAVVIATGTDLSPQHLKNFSSLDDDEKKNVLWEMRQKAVSHDVDFQFDSPSGQLGPLDCPTQVRFAATRFSDGLTLDSFVQSVGRVFKAELATMWLVEEHLGGGGPGPGRRFDFSKISGF